MIMSSIRRHNPALRSRLKFLVDKGDGEALLLALRNLTNSEARTAGALLADELFPEMATPQTFQDVFNVVVPTNARAYLGTFLKAAVKLYSRGHLDLTDERWKAFGAIASAIDCRKTLEALLPLASHNNEAAALLANFTDGTIFGYASAALRAGTIPAYYCMFRHLQQADADHDFLRNCCLQLLKRGRPRDFNMACILKTYFGLSNVPARFSLTLPVYKLSRLDLTLKSFEDILNQNN